MNRSLFKGRKCPAQDRGVWVARALSPPCVDVLERHTGAPFCLCFLLCANHQAANSSPVRCSHGLWKWHLLLHWTGVSEVRWLLHACMPICAGKAHKSLCLPVLPTLGKTPGCPLWLTTVQLTASGSGICVRKCRFLKAHNCPALDGGARAAAASSHQRLFALGRHKQVFSPVLNALCKTTGRLLLPTRSGGQQYVAWYVDYTGWTGKGAPVCRS